MDKVYVPAVFKSVFVRLILPPVLGGLGALAATAYPVFHSAFCSGAV